MILFIYCSEILALVHNNVTTNDLEQSFRSNTAAVMTAYAHRSLSSSQKTDSDRQAFDNFRQTGNRRGWWSWIESLCRYRMW